MGLKILFFDPVENPMLDPKSHTPVSVRLAANHRTHHLQ
jgi:hypothetical protein